MSAPVLRTGKLAGKPIDVARVSYVETTRLSDGRFVCCTPVNTYGHPCAPVHSRGVATFVGFWSTREEAAAWARESFPNVSIDAHP